MLKKIRLVWDDGAGCMHPVAGRSRTADSGVAYGMGWMPRLAGWNTSSRGQRVYVTSGSLPPSMRVEDLAGTCWQRRCGVGTGSSVASSTPSPQAFKKMACVFSGWQVWTGAISTSRNEAQPTVGVAQTRHHTSHHMIWSILLWEYSAQVSQDKLKRKSASLKICPHSDFSDSGRDVQVILFKKRNRAG